MLIVFPIILLLIILLSTQKMDKIRYSNSANRTQQQCIRGICTIAILFSHMFSNYKVFSDTLANQVLRSLFPSLVGLFFFYSGYGLMHKYLTKGRRNPFTIVFHLIIKLAPIIIVTYVIQEALEYAVYGEIGSLEIPLGGWFTKSLFVLYVVFAVMQTSKQKMVLILGITAGVFAYIIIGYKIELSSVYFMDCPLFILGAFLKAYEEKIKSLFENNAVFVSSSIGTIVWGGENVR